MQDKNEKRMKDEAEAKKMEVKNKENLDNFNTEEFKRKALLVRQNAENGTKVVLQEKPLTDEDLENSMPEQVAYKLDSSVKNEPGFKNLLEDYTALFKRTPVTREGGIVLEFDNEAEAVQFFKDQAKKNRAFNIVCLDAGVDHQIFSDGKGVFVQGTGQEVKDYLAHPENFNLDDNGKCSAKKSLSAGR